MPPILGSSARTAPFSIAKLLTESSFQWYGRTDAPFDTAISTAVENDKTSTITIASLEDWSVSRPSNPYSHLRSNSR